MQCIKKLDTKESTELTKAYLLMITVVLSKRIRDNRRNCSRLKSLILNNYCFH